MKTDPVKEFFEQTDVYLTFNYNLRIRMETVGYFIGDNRYGHVLDMPCGTGDISIPHLDRFAELTLMDFSENMVATAQSKIPKGSEAKIRLIGSDFYDYNFGEQQFDLIMNIGILAHIRDPWRFLEASVALLKPGGTLILQNTDSDHWFAKLIFVYLGLRRGVGKDKYALNKVPEKRLLETLDGWGMELLDSFRYNQSFLGLSHLFGNQLKYKLTRRYFGFAGNAKRQNTGSDATYLFRKKGG